MDLQSMRAPACVPVGVLATITMDVAMVVAGRLGESASTSDRYGPEVIGRWVTDSKVMGNAASDGGGIYNSGPPSVVTLDSVMIKNNTPNNCVGC